MNINTANLRKKIFRRMLLALTLLGALLLQGQTPPPYAQYLPIVQYGSRPYDHSVSIYIQNEAAANMYDLGCEQGRAVSAATSKQDHLVVLAFGKMWLDEASGAYGIRSFSDPTNSWQRHFISFPMLEEAGRNFVRGYWACSPADRNSTLTMALGTNNFDKLMHNSTFQEYELAGYYRTFGRYWAQMVLRLNEWIIANGMGNQVMAAGAIDIEWDTTGYWNTPAVTRAWTDGFAEASQNQAIYFNFGACVGCPNYSSINWKYSASMPWTQEDIYYVSWLAKPA